MEKVKNETLSVKQTLELYKTDAKNGLTEQEAQKRLEIYGKNELKEKKKKGILAVFFSQLNDPLIFVLFAAILLTIAVSIFETVKTINAGLPFIFTETGDWPDVIVIFAVIIINAVIGTVQEMRAETSLDALKKLSSPESTVIRDGKRYRIKSNLLVPGDIVVIEEGDTVGADLRLIEAVNLKINESSLTGESVPVEKNADMVFSEEVSVGDKINIAYMSTPVAYGRGIGVVVQTAMNTEIGKIADALSEESNESTPLQKVLVKLSKVLGILTLGVVFAVLLVDFVWIFIDGNGGQTEAYIEALLSAISLAVAAVPEGLATVVTIVLSIGVQKMVKVNTVVRKLPSVETLGSVGVVCSDKTGTLTQNRMTVVKAMVNYNVVDEKSFVKENNDEGVRLLAKGMSLCSNATVDNGIYGDPTEIALVSFANRFGMHKADLEKELPRNKELPFDSVRKMMSTLHKDKDNNIIFTKGAIDSILSRSNRIYDNGNIREITEEDKSKIYKQNSDFSDCALRVLALAMSYGDEIVEENLIFVGIVAMIDPPRPEAKPAVEQFKEAGIVTVMITGDHKDTAFAIAKELGICESKEQCYTGADVDGMTEAELKEVVKTARVFARVSPENKVQIVKAFKANGNIVAMTGDGVNDAPSLKTADIGIAMGITGTDVAKGAADMVLTDDNFASIKNAVEEGRSIYTNIKKTVLFLLSSNIAEVIMMFLLILIGLPAPLIAIHLLWVNLATDSLPAIALGMQPKDPDCMKKKPRNPNESIFSNGGIAITIGYGLSLTLGVILAYFMPAFIAGASSYSEIKALYTTSEYLVKAQTMAFTTLALCELFHMVGMSDTEHSFVHVFKDKNVMMLIAFVLGVALQLLVIEVGAVSKMFSTCNLSIYDWIISLLLGLTPLIIHELVIIGKKFCIRNKQK